MQKGWFQPELADVFDVSLDVLVRDSDVGLKEVTVEDRGSGATD